jgi:hypothetical protein
LIGALRWSAALALLVALGIAAAVVIDNGATAQERQFSRCHLGALKRFPDDTGIASKSTSFIAYCMAAAGYDVALHRGDDTLCSPGDPTRLVIESCYTPIGRFSRWLQSAEKWVEGR